MRVFQGVAKEDASRRGSARLEGPGIKKNWRLQALPARLRLGPDGVVAEAVPQETSADLFSLADADALFLAPEDEAPQDGGAVEWVELS